MAGKRSVEAPSIRLLYLVGQLGLGGSERQLYLLLKHLDGSVFERHVVVFNPSPHVVLNEALEEAGVQVWVMPPECRTPWSRLHYLAKVGRRVQPDLIHSWTPHDNVYATVLRRLAGSAVSLGSLRNLPGLAGFQALSLPYRLLALYGPSRLVVNASAIGEALIADGYPASRLVTILNCVEDAPREDDVPELPGIEPHHRVVGIVGNLRRVKNHEMFVQGMAQVVREHPDVRGVIVGQTIPGEEEARDRTEARVREMGLQDRVLLSGFRGDVPALMRRFSVCCLTSMSEGMPNVVLEAMAASRPVVATRVGGLPEAIVDGRTGFLVDVDDVDGFAKAVCTILEDPELARTMGERGRERVREMFHCAQTAEQFARLYLRLLKKEHLFSHLPPAIR